MGQVVARKPASFFIAGRGERQHSRGYASVRWSTCWTDSTELQWYTRPTSGTYTGQYNFLPSFSQTCSLSSASISGRYLASTSGDARPCLTAVTNTEYPTCRWTSTIRSMLGKTCPRSRSSSVTEAASAIEAASTISSETDLHSLRTAPWPRPGKMYLQQHEQPPQKNTR